jgi:murein DD-endopeptidase MepM/ murein hydrolase activator NlpD
MFRLIFAVLLLIGGAVAAAALPPAPTNAQPAPAEVVYSFPMGLPGRPLGDGFRVRHGYTVENTWFNPGHWHAGEDWYALEGDTADLPVYAVAGGTVRYVGSNYPGRVVIIEHPDGLFAMYGHLDPAVRVGRGERVERGQLLGTILRRNDTVPAHLHFEIRTFYFNDAVNGATPRYGYTCGVNCPPGPGYWPQWAPELPSDMGWRNPSHVILGRWLAPSPGSNAAGAVVVASQPLSEKLTLWSEPHNAPGAEPVARGEVVLEPGMQMDLLGRRPGREDSRQPGAGGYALWYQVRLPDGRTGWLQGAAPSTFETGSNGRPSTVRFDLLPAVSTPGDTPAGQ